MGVCDRDGSAFAEASCDTTMKQATRMLSLYFAGAPPGLLAMKVEDFCSGKCMADTSGNCMAEPTSPPNSVSSAPDDGGDNPFWDNELIAKIVVSVGVCVAI